MSWKDARRDEEVEREIRREIRRELEADHYRRTFGVKLKELAAAMRAEVAAAPGVIHLQTVHHCHCCGAEVGPEGQSKVNPQLFLCQKCRSR